MIRFGHGKTRVTVAWLAGAALACALIGTCLALLRSDVLPFRDAWPTTHGTRTPVSELAPPQPASQPGGRPSFAAQPVTIGGAPAIGLSGLPGLPSATGPLTAGPGSGPLGATLPGTGTGTGTGTGSAPAPSQTTTGASTVGAQGTTPLPAFPATPPTVPVTTTTPTFPATTTPDVAAPGPDAVQTSAASRPGPSGRNSDADATGADDDPPVDTTPATGDTPASPVDGDTPAGPANATPAAPTPGPTPAPSAPADSTPAAETPPVNTTPPADATSQPADPGPAQTPPAEDPAPTPPADTPPAPEQAASTPAPPTEIQPEQPAQTPPPADSAPQPDAPAAAVADGGHSGHSGCSH